MGNLFVNLPTPPVDGIGAAQDTSMLGELKTVTIQGAFEGSIFIDFSCGGSFQPLIAATQQGKYRFPFAAKEMRVRREGTVFGQPTIEVASDDTGAMFTQLPANGSSVDVSIFGTFNSVVVGNNVVSPEDIVYIDISENNVDWSTCLVFQQGEHQSKRFTAKYMRARSALGASLPDIHVGAINDDMGAVIGFGPPVTVVGSNNVEGVSPNATREDHRHRLEYEVEDEGVLVSARPRMDFVGAGVGAIDVPGEDLTRVTIPGDVTTGAVVKRSTYVGITSSTSSLVYVDGMVGLNVPVPIDGDYLAIFEGEGENSNANAILEIGISVDSLVAVVANSERVGQGNASDIRSIATSVQLPGLTAGQLVRVLFRKQSGAQSVSLHRRHLILIKVQ